MSYVRHDHVLSSHYPPTTSAPKHSQHTVYSRTVAQLKIGMRLFLIVSLRSFFWIVLVYFHCYYYYYCCNPLKCGIHCAVFSIHVLSALCHYVYWQNVCSLLLLRFGLSLADGLVFACVSFENCANEFCNYYYQNKFFHCCRRWRLPPMTSCAVPLFVCRSHWSRLSTLSLQLLWRLRFFLADSRRAYGRRRQS